VTIELEGARFVAYCDDNRNCMWNTDLAVKSFRVQAQTHLPIDTTAPATADQALHADDGAKAKRRVGDVDRLTTIERRQLERFRAELVRDGWLVRTDRSRPMGLLTICKNHNPATITPRPPGGLDW